MRRLVFIFLVLFSEFAYSGEVEDFVRNEAVILSQKLPLMLDTYIRLDSVTAYDRTLIYNATLLDEKSERLSAAEIESDLREHICSTGSGDLEVQRVFKWLKAKNVIYKYNYFNNEKKLITAFKIELKNCN